MACGEFGPGRMAEPDRIADAIEAMLLPARPLTGLRALVTAGPTREPLDPVRFLSNHSSGRQGYAIAQALAEAGAQTVLVSGPVALAAPPGVKLVNVETAREMLDACKNALPADVAIFAAAVADWRPSARAEQKLKKDEAQSPPTIVLTQNPDILATLAGAKNRPRLVIGFAAETEKLISFASAKRVRKGADWIVANDVSETGVMGSIENRVHLITPSGTESWPLMGKHEVARRLVARISETLASMAK
jgi:phosphopantothenoylcysteine decarboxylase/phosphopantothenate--cysteine ligase